MITSERLGTAKTDKEATAVRIRFVIDLPCYQFLKNTLQDRIVAMKDKQNCLRYGIDYTRLGTTDGGWTSHWIHAQEVDYGGIRS